MCAGYWDEPLTASGREIAHHHVLKAVEDLVEIEKSVLQRDDLFDRAELLVRNGPEILVNRIIAHIQYLFQIKSMSG